MTPEGDHRAIVARLRSVVEALDAARIPGVRDIVPGHESVLVVTDVPEEPESLRRAVERTALEAGGVPEREARTIQIPVCYEGEDLAPDLAEVAVHCGLSENDVVSRHSAGDYVVRFVGFMPGFPYLDGLDPALAVPRLATPRTRVPAGSVAIGGSQTGVYPFSTPGGWRIVGRTPARLYDPHRAPRALASIGDRVRFVPISRAAFDAASRG